jgi:hypothetical protein
MQCISFAGEAQNYRWLPFVTFTFRQMFSH